MSIYIPPKNIDMAEVSLRQIKWILHRIFKTDPKSSVVLAGDLNRIGMAKSDFIEKEFQLTPVLLKTDPTHRLGGHLDNVWTNLPITGTVIHSGLDHITDHSMISVKLFISKEVRTIKLSQECKTRTTREQI